MASVKVWVKKRLAINHLDFNEKQMFRLGTVGVAEVKHRVGQALGPNDSPAKPLTKKYAIRKSRLRLGNRRNLTFTGDMLRNLQVRTVSRNTVRSGNSTRLDRIKARANARLEQWLVFSDKNQQRIMRVARILFGQSVNVSQKK